MRRALGDVDRDMRQEKTDAGLTGKIVATMEALINMSATASPTSETLERASETLDGILPPSEINDAIVSIARKRKQAELDSDGGLNKALDEIETRAEATADDAQLRALLEQKARLDEAIRTRSEIARGESESLAE